MEKVNIVKPQDVRIRNACFQHAAANPLAFAFTSRTMAQMPGRRNDLVSSSLQKDDGHDRRNARETKRPRFVLIAKGTLIHMAFSMRTKRS